MFTATRIANWLQLYEDGGIEALREIKDPGPDPGQQSIPPEVMEKLKKRLSKPEGFGSYKETNSGWPRSMTWSFRIRRSTGSCATSWRPSQKLEAKPKAPRPSHPKKASESK